MTGRPRNSHVQQQQVDFPGRTAQQRDRVSAIGCFEHCKPRLPQHLPHSQPKRIFIFHNDGQEEIYLGSSDWMNRNIYRRIEVCFPLYEPRLKDEIRELIRLQLTDTAAATPIDSHSENPATDPLSPSPLPQGATRSQEAIYYYLASK